MWKAFLLLGALLVAACCAQTPIVGGYEDAEVDDEGVLEAAGHAARQMSKQFFSSYHHRLVKVVKAKRQVVAGLNYKMEIVLGMTTCKKAEVEYEQAQQCDLQGGYKKCSVRVYRDLEGNHRLVAYGCYSVTEDDI